MILKTQEVLKAYKFPFAPRKDQIADIEYLSQYTRKGVFLDMGLGKTFTSTAIALYLGLEGLIDQVLCVVPPILIKQWQLWLENDILDAETGKPALDVAVYYGPPAKRKAIKLDKDFTITTLGIFKNDHDRFMRELGPKKVALIVDEAAAIRMPGTGNYAAVRDFINTPGKFLQMLTGTPLGANPATAYGYIALKSPGLYRDMRDFYMMHVTSVDQYDVPNGFTKLDLLREHLMIDSVYRQAEEVLDLPDVTYIPVKYALHKPHQVLYDKLIEEFLIELDNGVVIDATTQNRMYTQSQKILINVPDGGKTRPAAFDVLDQVIEETGLLRKENEKLMVFTHFRASNEAVRAYLDSKGIGSVQIYGGQNNIKAVGRFRDDRDIKIAVASVASAGIGLNLQFCCYQLFLEIPRTSGDFQQAVARIKRSGQERKCRVWIATAIGTVQETLQRNVVKKEDILQQVVTTATTLRAALMGRG